MTIENKKQSGILEQNKYLVETMKRIVKTDIIENSPYLNRDQELLKKCQEMYVEDKKQTKKHIWSWRKLWKGKE